MNRRGFLKGAALTPPALLGLAAAQARDPEPARRFIWMDEVDHFPPGTQIEGAWVNHEPVELHRIKAGDLIQIHGRPLPAGLKEGKTYYLSVPTNHEGPRIIYG